jgi:tetratricopeptide (TPR) repeat protein
MRTWLLILTAGILLSVATLSAREPDPKELAQKGYSAFKEALAGDEAKLAEAIRYMEQARNADDTYVPNLYNLARAYFLDTMIFNREESISKAEKTFARMIELDPSRTDAMAFHGAILAQMSGGRDLDIFMRGAQELKTAFQRTPDDLTVRIVLAFTSQNIPPQARSVIGVTDPVGDLKFIGNVFDSFSSDFAPHASVVMNAFIGEAQMMAGEKEKARASFEKALKVAEPDDEGQLAGRKRLESTITTRMNGGEKPIFADPLFAGCHSCHLSAPDKLLTSK